MTNGHDGLLVPEHSPEELAQAILKMMTEPALLSRCSRNAANSVRANFGSDTQVAAMENVYFAAMQSGAV